MKPTSLHAEVLLEVGAHLGEGPIWDDREDALLFVDIIGEAIYRYRPEIGQVQHFDVGMPVGAVVTGLDSSVIIAAVDGFYRAASLGQQFEPVGSFKVDRTVVRFNDGKVDPRGRFVAGTMPWGGKEPLGSLYVLEPGGDVRELLNGVTISNGLAWTESGRRLYYIDSPTHSIDVFDVEPDSRVLGNRKSVATIPDAHPDGMAIDDEGLLWVAVAGGYRVDRVDPRNGDVVARVEVPVRQVTSVAFGGARLDQLFITTGKGMMHEGENPSPHAGDVFVVDPGVTGPPASRFAG